MGPNYQMIPSFKLSQFTSLDDVAEWTQVGQVDEIKLQIGASSGFAPTVEGVALGALQQVAQKSKVTVECGVAAEKSSKIFESLFGLSVALVARKIIGPADQDQKTPLAAHLWQKVQLERGQIGSGNHVSIVFRDPDYLDAAVPS